MKPSAKYADLPGDHGGGAVRMTTLPCPTESVELNYFNEDCMVGMSRYPDKAFDLAIVDPPYFSGPERRRYYGRSQSKTGVFRSYNPSVQRWCVPQEDYFNELERVCRHYIVWGCNYFDHKFPEGRIVWDKCNGRSTFSDAEIAATTLFKSVRLFPFMWNGMMQGKSISDGRTQQGNKTLNEIRIHPTQKPVALYEWILKTFAKPGWKILDTHVGSGSSLIACHKLGLSATGFEIDPIYYASSCERIKRYARLQSDAEQQVHIHQICLDECLRPHDSQSQSQKKGEHT